jgi:hypothetical protein
VTVIWQAEKLMQEAAVLQWYLTKITENRTVDANPLLLPFVLLI